MRRFTRLGCVWVALVSACNVESLVQDFHDQHGPGTDTDAGTGAAASTSGAASTDADTTGPGGTGSSGSAGASSGSSGEVVGSTSDSTGTGSTTDVVTAVCGDGVVEGDEECDDPGDTWCYKCVRDRLVFVTSQDVYADFGGRSLAGLIYPCNHLAAVAGLLTNSQPRFKPWVSTSEGSPAEFLHHSRGRYVLRNGLVFAESWDALVAGEILNPLNVDENSQTRNAAVFTDTRPDGSAMPGNHCEDWSSESSDEWIYWGDSLSADGSWSLYTGEATNPVTCQGPAALYCFESP